LQYLNPDEITSGLRYLKNERKELESKGKPYHPTFDRACAFLADSPEKTNDINSAIKG